MMLWGMLCGLCAAVAIGAWAYRAGQAAAQRAELKKREQEYEKASQTMRKMDRLTRDECLVRLRNGQ